MAKRILKNKCTFKFNKDLLMKKYLRNTDIIEKPIFAYLIDLLLLRFKMK